MINSNEPKFVFIAIKNWYKTWVIRDSEVREYLNLFKFKIKIPINHMEFLSGVERIQYRISGLRIYIIIIACSTASIYISDK